MRGDLPEVTQSGRTGDGSPGQPRSRAGDPAGTVASARTVPSPPPHPRLALHQLPSKPTGELPAGGLLLKSPLVTLLISTFNKVAFNSSGEAGEAGFQVLRKDTI